MKLLKELFKKNVEHFFLCPYIKYIHLGATKRSLLCVHVFSTPVLIEDTVLRLLVGDRTAISTWSSEPRAGQRQYFRQKLFSEYWSGPKN